MSVKEFFAFANIKQSVVEFLKTKSDFEALNQRYKRPFRAHINKHVTNQDSEPLTSTNQQSDYFVSDGFNSIKCGFSAVCKEFFSKTYPNSINIFNTVNMLICI